MKGKIRGLYKRGNIFWFKTQKSGRRLYVSLETSDFAEAVQKASLILETPGLNPTQGLKADLATFLDYQVSHNLWTPQTMDSKAPILQKFGRFLNWLPTAQIRREHLQDWYETLRQEKKRNGCVFRSYSDRDFGVIRTLIPETISDTDFGLNSDRRFGNYSDTF